MKSAPPSIAAVVERHVASLKHQPGALLPILHAVQDELTYVPDEAIAIIADALNQTRAEISGVISFYHHFRRTPPGDHVLQICRAEACQARGAKQLETHIKQRLNIDYHQTSADGRVSLEPVYCLGNCSCGPSIRIGNAIHGRVSPARFEQLLDDMTTQVVELV
jgi:formate dehydrogenase subunit gamma